jgi:hypothetical protein
MSPYYVLITVVDDTRSQSRTGCITSNLLIGAISMERALPSDRAGFDTAQKVALANTRHVFHFSKSSALANVAFGYSAHDLEVARRLLVPLSDEQLRQAFSPGELQPSGWSDASRNARTCALIERGLSLKMADRSGGLLLDP